MLCLQLYFAISAVPSVCPEYYSVCPGYYSVCPEYYSAYQLYSI